MARIRWPGESRRRSSEVERTESFRLLRTNLEVVLLDLERPTVVITSALPGEGKSATCAQLAHALATMGRRVVVVDADLRSPDQHKWFGVDNARGVSDVLLERSSVGEALRFLTIGRERKRAGMYLLPAGQPVDNPTELLNGGRMARLLETLASQCDVVLIDSAPVLPVADTLVVGRLVAGAILVLEARTTPIEAAIAARDALIRNQTRVLGAVVNKVRGGSSSIGYGYGYGYGDDGGSR